MPDQPQGKPTQKLPRELLVEVICAAALLFTGAAELFGALVHASDSRGDTPPHWPAGIRAQRLSGEPK